jgi:homogentisate 1,2-dioxygenase
MSRSFEIHSPERVIFGAGCSRRIAEEMKFERVLVVSTKGRAHAAKTIADTLGARSVGVLAIAEEHVPRAIADEGRKVAAEKNADAVLAYGGGSAIGLAKAIALDGKAKVVAVPTTYSGSEMTSLWGITDGNEKRVGKDDRARPTLVFYDPELLGELPPAVAVASVWNAMAHAVETLWAPNVDSGSMTVAEVALRKLARSVAHLSDAVHRAEALEGAHLAGSVFARVGSGLHHKLCHRLGGAYGMPHAATHAALLPHMVRHHRDSTPAAMRAIARALGVVDPVRGIETLARSTGVAVPLAKLGMPREGIERFGELPDVRATLARAWAGLPTHAAPPPLRAPKELPTQGGFGSTHESEALEGALPRDQNAPRRCPYGLIPELINGTPFTVRNVENSRMWTYRIHASFSQTAFHPLPTARFAAPLGDVEPNRSRWAPHPIPAATSPTDFLDGLITLGGAGEPASGPGFAIHLYAANSDMLDRCFSNGDGDLLVIPQEGALDVRTELGWLKVPIGSVLFIPRGLKFAIGLPDNVGRGWMLEVFGTKLKLPERGLIGSNGLADARHFRAPVASYEDRECPDGFQHVTKTGGCLFEATHSFSPFDVVAWHGNHAPFVYDLMHFSPVAAVRFDHQDPSIFTVLTAPLDDHGRAIADFVFFPPRWDVIEHSFRPPFAHRNAASEVNMVVRTPKPYSTGYEPGCTFLSPLLTAHGVGTKTYDAILDLPDDHVDPPQRIPDESLWAMVESALPFRTTQWARETELADGTFLAAFEGMRSRFDPKKR